jgi:hypothetical protein
MGYRPPKGVRPPQLEGKRCGRPKGSRNRSSLLLAMLHVWRRGPEEDKTEFQKMMRKYMKEHTVDFLDRLVEMEHPDDELDDE